MIWLLALCAAIAASILIARAVIRRRYRVADELEEMSKWGGML